MQRKNKLASKHVARTKYKERKIDTYIKWTINKRGYLKWLYNKLKKADQKLYLVKNKKKMLWKFDLLFFIIHFT